MMMLSSGQKTSLIPSKLFKPVPTVTVDVVADTLVTTTKPTGDDGILPSPEGIDDSNVDGTNNLIVSPEGV